MKTRRARAACLLAAGALVASAIIPAGTARAASGDTGSVTSVTTVPGKAQGTGKWGFVGDIETLGGRTYNYGLAFSPTDDSLWVTDSGKVVYNALLCRLAGFPQTTCQTGTPRVFRYGLTGDQAGAASEADLTSYAGNGGYSASSVWNNGDSSGKSIGLGGRYVPSSERTTYTYPAPGTQHGPRGIAFTPDGRAFVADSEALAPLAAKEPGAMSIFGPDLSLVGGAGFSAPWAQHGEPGVVLYHTGSAVTPDGLMVTNSEIADRLVYFNQNGTPAKAIDLDLPDKVYRNPYSVAVDPVDGSLYIPLVNFRDDPTVHPFLEKRDASGAVVKQFAFPDWFANQVVMGAAVEPKTQHVFAWGQNTGALVEWDKDGNYVATYSGSGIVGATNNTVIPGLTTPRGLAFDANGRMYVTLAEGTSAARVMILGKTPEPVNGACASYSDDKTTVTLTWDCLTTDPDTGLAPYQGAPVLDYVVEVNSGSGWAVASHPASTEKTRTLTGLDPTLTYSFRVSAWNEAGNGDWQEFTVNPFDLAEDSATVAAGETTTIAVLDNDTAPAGSTVALVGDDGASVTELTRPEGTYTVVDNAVRLEADDAFTGTAGPISYRVVSGDCADDAQLTVTVVKAGLALTKTAHLVDGNGDGIGQPGESVDYTFEVTNTGTVPVDGVAVDDPMLPVTCPAGPLAPEAKVSCTGSLTLTDANVAAATDGKIVNVATATADWKLGDEGRTVVSDESTAEVSVKPTVVTPTTTPTPTGTPSPTASPTPSTSPSPSVPASPSTSPKPTQSPTGTPRPTATPTKPTPTKPPKPGLPSTGN